MSFCTRLARLTLFCVLPASLAAQTKGIPDWCKPLPRPEYETLLRMPVNDPWFEVYRVAPDVYAIYEPHQAEETISYLIVGSKQALLFDTGMGIGNIQKVTSQLTKRFVVVLNSHTHNDHVGGNWQFNSIFGMNTAFTRANAKGSRTDAQAEIASGQICGVLPAGFNPKTYATKPWRVSFLVHDGFVINLGGGRKLEVIATPGHTPDAIALLDRENGLLFSGDTYYPAPIWLYRPETDMDAYVASAKKLAALAPEVKLVLGAHNEKEALGLVGELLVTLPKASAFVTGVAARSHVPAAANSIQELATLAGNRVAYAAGDPTWGIVASTGAK